MATTTTTTTTARFEQMITLHRFIRSDDCDLARQLAQRGVLIAAGAFTDPRVAIEKVVVGRPRVAPYRHAGESVLWWVSLDVRATLVASSSDAAIEAAHQLVTVSADESSTDAFEYEVQVWGSRDIAAQLQAA